MQLHLQNGEETHRNQSFNGQCDGISRPFQAGRHDRRCAVGSAGPILNLLLVLFVGISIGTGIMVSQYFGARQREELSLSIGWCDSYLKILFVGCIGSAYYNILSGVLRGLGDSVSALIYLVVATLLNIVLDYVFVAWFGMGVAGVALATIIAQAVSAALCLRRLMRMKDIFDMNRKYLKPRKEYMSIRLPLAYLLVFLTRTPENPLGNSAMLFVSTLVSWVIGTTLTFVIYKAGRWKKKAILGDGGF